MAQYSIGEFARYLGVTPDFLKYCLKNELMEAEIADNGYRSFDFRQSASAIEYLKLKNQGYSAKEIKEILHGENAFEKMLDQNRMRKDMIRRNIRFQEELLKYYDFTEKISSQLTMEKNWEVLRVEGFYFIPHTMDGTFVEDPAILRRIKEWNEYLPVVSSTMWINIDRQYSTERRTRYTVWGYGISKTAAQHLELNVSSPVTHVKAGRMLCIYGSEMLEAAGYSMVEYALSIAERMGESPLGDMYYRVIAKTNERRKRKSYAVLYVPLK